MDKRRLIQIIKVTWTILIVGGAVFYFITHFNNIAGYLRSISPLRLMLALSLLFVAKLFLAQLSRWSVQGFGLKISFWEMFNLNALIQLAKYLPGGIWHFVGRVGYYRERGLSFTDAGRAMVVENIWLLLSAVSTGILVLLPSYQSQICAFFKQSPDCIPAYLLAVLWLTVLLLWWVILALTLRYGFKQARRPITFVVPIWAAEILVWGVIGVSTWVLFPTLQAAQIPTAIGAFAIGWALGYVTIFAPGGLGIRELGLATLLTGIMLADQALLVATLSRILWVLAEILVGLIASGREGYQQFAKTFPQK